MPFLKRAGVGLPESHRATFRQAVNLPHSEPAARCSIAEGDR